MVQVDTQLTQQEFIKFNLSLFLRKPQNWLYAVLIGFVFASAYFDFNENGIEGFTEADTFEQLLPFLFTVLYLGFFCWVVYRQSKRNYIATISLHEPIAYTFSETGMNSKGSSFESDIDWNVVYKVLETKEWFLIYQNDVVANVVPKAAFQSEEQVRALRMIIASQQNLKHKLRRD